MQFDQVETCPYLQSNGIGISRKRHELLVNTDILRLSTNLFDVDALIFRGLKSRAVTLRSKRSKKSVRVEFPSFACLGIWSKPGASYVCVEPWYGIDDFSDSAGDVMSKDGIELLSPYGFSAVNTG